MAKYRIFDPATESLEEVEKRIEKNGDLVTRCELAMYLRKHKRASRWLTILSYCLTTSLAALDDIRIARDQSGPSNSDAYEAKLAEIDEKLDVLEANPKDTKRHQALLASLTRQRIEYQRLVAFGDIPQKHHKSLVTLELMLKRLGECVEKLGAEGVTYQHLLSVFPSLSRFMED